MKDLCDKLTVWVYSLACVQRGAREKKRAHTQTHRQEGARRGASRGEERKQRQTRRRRATRAEHAKNNKGMGFDAALRMITKSHYLCTRLLAIFGRNETVAPYI